MEIKIKLVHQTEKLNVLSIATEGKAKNAFEDFLLLFENNTRHALEFQLILESLENIGKYGAKKDFFTQAKGMRGRLYQLHELGSKPYFKILCLLIREDLLLIGGHGINYDGKSSLTNDTAYILHELDPLIAKAMDTGRFKIIDGKIQGSTIFRLP